jgi:hypothetical protein
MNKVVIRVPENTVANSEESNDDTEVESQFLLALKLFEMGRVTTSQAAGMCGMPSVDFLLAAARTNPPTHYDQPSR